LAGTPTGLRKDSGNPVGSAHRGAPADFSNSSQGGSDPTTRQKEARGRGQAWAQPSRRSHPAATPRPQPSCQRAEQWLFLGDIPRDPLRILGPLGSRKVFIILALRSMESLGQAGRGPPSALGASRNGTPALQRGGEPPLLPQKNRRVQVGLQTAPYSPTQALEMPCLGTQIVFFCQPAFKFMCPNTLLFMLMAFCEMYGGYNVAGLL